MARVSRRSALLLLLGACGFPRLDALKDDARATDDARAPGDAPASSDARVVDASPAADASPIDAPPIDAPPIDAPPIDAPPIDAAAKSCTINGTNVVIAQNHGHTLVVSKADVIAGADKTYDIQGVATHSHAATVTAAQFGQLQADMTTTLTSTVNNSHSHFITITCA